MKIFIPSPFDTLIIELSQSVLKNPDFKPLTDLGYFVFSFIERLRTAYIAYSFLDEPYQDPLQTGSNRKLTLDEMVSMSDSGIKVSLDYFSLINELNQFGGFLKEKFSMSILSYEEVYFFRNKVSEHWDDYIKYKPGRSAMGKAGKRPVPFLLGKRSLVSEMLRLKNNLINEFSKYKITISPLDGLYYQDYANIIYPALKKIDPELKSKSTKKSKQFIPESLVHCLFEFEFPLPIYDIEDYCEKLVIHLKNFQLTEP